MEIGTTGPQPAGRTTAPRSRGISTTTSHHYKALGPNAWSKPATPKGVSLQENLKGSWRPQPERAAPRAYQLLRGLLLRHPSKLRITTLAGARVRLENITEVIRIFLSERGAAPDYRLIGGKFGKSYTVEFKGGAEIGGPLVRAALSSLRLPDGTYRKLTCPAPVEGEPAVALFLNPDQDATKKANDWHFRCLKRAVQALRPDPAYLCDSRDLLVSLRWRAVVQLAWDWNNSTYKVVWFEAGAGNRFSAEDRADAEKGYFDAVSPPGGG